MPLASGYRLGAYEIASPLGAGGMGEVYRARDTRLKRDVAVKVLPTGVAGDREQLARFQREAEMLAALNHPNIAHIYSVEDHDGAATEGGSHVSPCIVMELVEGEDLSQRIARGAIPLDDALSIARQIADALEAAHDAGVIHRDLKPSNVKVRVDGTVKVLDFGLARPSGPDATAAHASTITSPAKTQRGVILGTAAYMAPEQAKGEAVDKRADIWAFGCVLYEMLTGRRPFHGPTTTELIAAILEREPDFSQLPHATPSSVRRVLRRALTKKPSARLRDIADAKPDLDGSDDPVAAPAPPQRSALWGAMAGAALATVLVWLFVAGRERAAGTLPASPVVLPLASVEASLDLTLSSDGSTMAWTGTGADGRRRIWIRRLSSNESFNLEGTEGATEPFLAPDGRAVAFFQGGSLKRIDLDSRSMRTLAASAPVSPGGSWNTDDVILFSSRFGLQRIPAAGGAAELVVPLNPEFHENSVRFPQFLPDGRHFIYVARSGRTAESGVYLAALDASPRRLFGTLAKVRFAPPDLLLYVDDGVLMAQRFDIAGARLLGEPTTITADLHTDTVGLRAAYAVSENGILAYSPAQPPETHSLHWFDRSGRDLGRFQPPRAIVQFRIAPDGRRVAAAVADASRGGRSIWVFEADRSPMRLTFSETDDWEPLWSPDGTRVAFASYRNGPLDIFVKAGDGRGVEAPLLQSEVQKDLNDWSPDGKHILYREAQENFVGDLVAMEVANPANRIAITRSPVEERHGRWSGDGKWVAYVSLETGTPEVFVQPFPPTGEKLQISVDGGDDPVWRGDTLYYIDRNGMLIAVSAHDTASAPTKSQPLFRVGASRGFSSRYDVLRDGSRFLVAVDEPRPPVRPPIVMLNWTSRLKPQ